MLDDPAAAKFPRLALALRLALRVKCVAWMEDRTLSSRPFRTPCSLVCKQAACQGW